MTRRTCGAGSRHTGITHRRVNQCDNDDELIKLRQAWLQ
eukprot:CAMPEP_0119426870 /NCGR_PEP_ID=MMETSP1335-20130426/37199_1 /TAXON_ID=259385 /ORGANISM="Chrysoculter rhomboideus, Strain RCC1486" /LENGTH=38 /DNA_ID= /DNA_START= /DNA_END= /DNA_ORIENTATION=